MLKNPKISVIMSVYNGEKYLREAIESILDQTFIDFEFIIVIDPSIDNSLEIIQSYDDERIEIINNEKNIGLTQSLNKALKIAKGEYIARQDADDISLPNRFEEQITYLEKYPEVALLGTSAYKIDENGKIIEKFTALAKPTIKNLFKGNLFYHGSVMLRKGIINELGGYNELITYPQDYELWLRIAKHYKVGNLTQLLYKWRFHGENMGFSNIEQSIIEHILVLKIAKNDLNEDLLKTVKEKGIINLHSFLNKGEKIYFHKAIANTYIEKNELKLARSEFRKVLKLNPFDIHSHIHIVMCYFGKILIDKSHRVYRSLRSFYHAKFDRCSL